MALSGTLAIALALVAFVLTKDHWWKEVGGARVTYNGQLSTASRVYQSGYGDLLIVLSDEPAGRLYIFHRQSENVGIPSRSTFVFLPLVAYSKLVPPPAPLMQSAKIEIDPQLNVHERVVEFNSFDEGRVRVSW